MSTDSATSSDPRPGSPATPPPPYINLGSPAENGHHLKTQPKPNGKSKPLPHKLGPQRLIILCDGTWGARLDVEVHEDSGFDGKTVTGKDGWIKSGSFFTNISLLAQVLEPIGEDQEGNEVRQTVLYQSGVGAVPSLIGRYVEGATGSSLPDKVMEAYGFICDNYKPVAPGEEADKIYLFGFSRGAYTARTIAGFLAWAGVMTRQQCSTHFKAIWEAYHARDASDPDTLAHADEVLFQRLGKHPSPYASHVAQIAKDNAAKLKLHRSPLAKAASKISTIVTDPLRIRCTQGWTDEYKPTGRDPALCVVPAPIEVVGVWDTVGALGTPGRFELPEMARYHSFFDPIPAPTIKYAFQALSLGEDREDFSPTLWVRPPHPGLTPDGDLAIDPQYKLERAEDVRLRQGQVLKQVWFKGDHSDVGGGHSWHGLSDVTLAWMVGQLVDCKDGPLLNIDIEKLKNLQDRRRPWGRQREHPSRVAFQFQKYRSVLPYSDSKIRARLQSKPMSKPNAQVDVTLPDEDNDWRNIVEAGDTFESLHYSVTLGDEYLFDDGQPAIPKGGKGRGIPAVFSKVAKMPGTAHATKLRELWFEAQTNPPTGTEAKLMWSLEDSQVLSASSATLAGIPVASSSRTAANVDLELRPCKPAWMPSAMWKLFIWTIESPLRLSVMFGNILNRKPKFWQQHEKNLAPFITTRLIQASKTWPTKLRQAKRKASISRHPQPRMEPVFRPKISTAVDVR